MKYIHSFLTKIVILEYLWWIYNLEVQNFELDDEIKEDMQDQWFIYVRNENGIIINQFIVELGFGC